MKKSVLIFGLMVGIGICNCRAQGRMGLKQEVQGVTTDSVVSHKVQQGETVMMLARKYHTTPKDIYKLNPAAVDGISYNMVLSIPAEKTGVRERKPLARSAQAYVSDKD